MIEGRKIKAEELFKELEYHMRNADGAAWMLHLELAFGVRAQLLEDSDDVLIWGLPGAYAGAFGDIPLLEGQDMVESNRIQRETRSPNRFFVGMIEITWPETDKFYVPVTITAPDLETASNIAEQYAREYYYCGDDGDDLPTCNEDGMFVQANGAMISVHMLQQFDNERAATRHLFNSYIANVQFRRVPVVHVEENGEENDLEDKEPEMSEVRAEERAEDS